MGTPDREAVVAELRDVFGGDAVLTEASRRGFPAAPDHLAERGREGLRT